jgi:hypothetical protein
MAEPLITDVLQTRQNTILAEQARNTEQSDVFGADVKKC